MILNKTELDHLGRVIGEVEQTTAGELRLVIVKRSASVTFVWPLLWLTLTCLGLIALWFERARFNDAPAWALPAGLIAAAVLSNLLARVPAVARAFVGRPDLRHAARVRAELEFHREGLTKTKDATGILLFLSLFDHQAVVLADAGIAGKCAPDTWDGVVRVILEGAAQRRWAPKLEEALRACGKVLAEHFPIQPDDVNELSNAVVIKD